MPRLNVEMTANLLLWLGRGLALTLFLFWGAFFDDHLSEWFLNPRWKELPTWVWIYQFFHLLMVLGLALSLRWDMLGSAVLVLGTVAFFSSLGLHAQRFPWIALVNLPPLVCFALARLLRHRPPAPLAAPAP